MKTTSFELYKLHFMVRKTKNTTETEKIDIGPDVIEPVVLETIQVQNETAPQKPVAPKTDTTVQKTPIPPKKRIRIRPSQKKKLSVAVLCTNPLTRRFI